MKKLVQIVFFVITFQIAAQPPGDLGQPASIESQSAIESSLKIYPNPAKGTVAINMRLPQVSQARIALHDMLGNEVELLTDNASGAFERTFDLNAIRSGIYLVRISYNNGQNTIVRKIVVQ